MSKQNPTTLSPAESARRLAGYAAVLRDTTVLSANAAVVCPEIEHKILFGRHLHQDATLVARMAARCEELAVTLEVRAAVTAAPLLRALAQASRAPASRLRIFGVYDVVKAELVAQMDAHLRACHRLLDEPTVRLLEEAAGILRGQIDEAVRARRRVAELLEGAPADLTADGVLWRAHAAVDAGSNLDLTEPALPARDGRFVVGEGPAARPSSDAGWRPRAIYDLHYTLMSLEIATIEACGRSIAQFPDMPWDFVRDMARQAWDEARHAEACYERILELGGRIGQHPTDHRLWELTGGLPLVLRLSIHQRIGEWIGVDGALWMADTQKETDPITARLFEFVAADEITHVAIGNKWIRRLAGDDDAEVGRLHEEALRRRASCEKVDGPRPFPFNRWACERAGFTEAEITALERPRPQGGSR